MDKTKEEALNSLLSNFFLPRMQEDASDEVQASLQPRGPKNEIRWRLSGKHGHYDHELDAERVEAFKGDISELIDFLSAEMNLSVTRYWRK